MMHCNIEHAYGAFQVLLKHQVAQIIGYIRLGCCSCQSDQLAPRLQTMALAVHASGRMCAKLHVEAVCHMDACV